MAFKHPLGSEVQSKITGLKGVITSRSENIHMCNRYFIQPPANSENKVPDGWWVDEDDIDVLGHKVTPSGQDTGGPMSKIC